MDVQLINCTGWGSADPARQAAELLVFTKGTRLNMDAGRMNDVQAMSDEEIENELIYMSQTIPSSWEFIDYTFLVNDVTRAFTHQMVRTRVASFAQQTMRVLNKSGWTYETGPTIEDDANIGNGAIYHDTMAIIAKAYDDMVEGGAAIEDARGVLPTNIHTNIVAKYNLRTLCDMFRKRASGRTQSEYRDVIMEMKNQVLAVHPWASLFIERDFDRAAADLESDLRVLSASGQALDKDSLTNLVKLIDQMRMQA